MGYIFDMDMRRRTSLALTAGLAAMVVADALTHQGIRMTAYALTAIAIVNLFDPLFRYVFRTQLSYPVLLADLVFAVVGTYVGNRLDLYERLFAYDIALHFISGILIVLTFYEVFFPPHRAQAIPFAIRLALAAIIGLAGAALWEIMEFSLDVIAHSDVQRNLRPGQELIGRSWQNPGLVDTMNDMIDGLAGSLVGCAMIFFRQRQANGK